MCAKAAATLAIAAALVISSPMPDAVAQPTPASPMRARADLDGMYAWLGPVGAAEGDGAGIDSAFGATVAITQVRERRLLATRGLAVTAMRRGAARTGALALEAVAGTRLGRGPHLGLTLGPALALAADRHPRAGLTASIWTLVGPTFFVRAFATGDGWELSAGLSILLPARRW